MNSPLDKENTPNILLIILDSVRSHNMGLHGYERETTPFLNEFANESVHFTQARAPGIHSVASHASIFTGRHVEEHRAIHHSSRIDSEKTIWPKLSRNYGHTTGLFTTNPIISKSSNLFEPFDSVWDPFRKKLYEDAYGPTDTNQFSGIVDNARVSLKQDSPGKSLINCAYHGLDKVGKQLGILENPHSIHGERVAKAFQEWKRDQNGPWAACINLMDTHFPYVPDNRFNMWSDADLIQKQNEFKYHKNIPPNENEEAVWKRIQPLKDLYDGTILQADNIVKGIVNDLKEGDEFENTLVIITSDHGEGFAEQSYIDPSVRIGYHRYGIHEVLTHVPLIVNNNSKTGTLDSVISLSNIPDLIFNELENDGKISDLGSREALSSTFRMEEGECRDGKYRGPWRAVYEDHSGCVRKYSKRGVDVAILDICGPHDVEKVDGSDGSKVDELFSNLEKKAIMEGSGEIESSVRKRLEKLGYMNK